MLRLVFSYICLQESGLSPLFRESLKRLELSFRIYAVKPHCQLGPMVVQMFAGEWVFATFIRKDIHTGVLFLYI